MKVILILTVTLLSLMDSFDLLKRGQFRELSTIGLFIGIAMFLLIAESVGISTPIDWLLLLRPVGEAIFEVGY